MSNPATIDRRDVAHPTNPIGGHDHIGRDAPGRGPQAGAGSMVAGTTDREQRGPAAAMKEQP